MEIWSKYAVHVWKKWKLMIFDQNVKKSSSSRSTKSLRSGIRKIRVKSEGLLPMVGEKSKKWNRCNFFRRVRRFRIKISSLFENQNVFQSYSAFQSKNGSVSWKKSAKSEKWPKFPPFGLCFCDSDENGFLASSSPKPCANQCFLVHSAIPDSGPSSRDFTCSLLVKNLMEFQWFWGPFGPFLRVTNERTNERRTDRPRQAPPRAVNSQPVKGPAPHSNIGNIT